MHTTYLYQNKNGLISDLNPLGLVDTAEKRSTILYSFMSFGFIPFLAPLCLLPTLGHFTTYYIISCELWQAQGIYMHYRITLAALLTWATILALSRFKKLNNNYIALYLFVCVMGMQYFLHLPLSYLSKQWFWTEPSGIKNIEVIKEKYLPANASVVSQNNITPHISNRDKIYTLYPEKKTFTEDSPCGQESCDWFRWYGNPEFLFVDTSPEWDARHLLIDRGNYIKGLENLEKEGVVSIYKQVSSAILYKVNKSPELNSGSTTKY